MDISWWSPHTQLSSCSPPHPAPSFSHIFYLGKRQVAFIIYSSFCLRPRDHPWLLLFFLPLQKHQSLNSINSSVAFKRLSNIFVPLYSHSYSSPSSSVACTESSKSSPEFLIPWGSLNLHQRIVLKYLCLNILMAIRHQQEELQTTEPAYKVLQCLATNWLCNLGPFALLSLSVSCRDWARSSIRFSPMLIL